MLRPEHIRVLKLDRNKLEEHGKLPPPSYSIKALTKQLSTISDVTVSTLLNLDVQEFKEQLDRARTYGVSYLIETADKRLIGISAATSLIRQGSVLRKHLIIPKIELQGSNGLDKHLIIGVFIRSVVVDNYLPLISRVEIAGWIDADEIAETQVANIPQTFKSKLDVVMIPCAKLNPIATLVEAIWPKPVASKDDQPGAEGAISEDSRVYVRDGKQEGAV